MEDDMTRRAALPPSSRDDATNDEFAVRDSASDVGGVSPRGPWARADGRFVIGRVAAPPRQEATSSTFYFWAPPDALVEKTQLVVAESQIAGTLYRFFAMIDEVFRSSRKRGMGQEIDEADADVRITPLFESDGYTYARATILRTQPAVLIPPRERSDVLLASDDEVGIAYSADEIERPLPIGLIKNGGDQLAGVGTIDLDYLLGREGGHMNVNGSAGRGTKSSFLLFTIAMLLREAQWQAAARPSDPDRLRIVPIILNVKNFDLFYIDRRSRRYDSARHAATWEGLGISAPVPFQNVTYFAAQRPNDTLPIPTGRQNGVSPFSWSLRDVVGRGLFLYLFAEVDANDTNFGALALDIESWLTDETMSNDGVVTRSLRRNTGGTSPGTPEVPQTLGDLLTWIQSQSGLQDNSRILRNHSAGTWRKLYRRLLKLLYDGGGTLRRDDSQGNPLDLVRADTSDPVVVDLSALTRVPEMQRFVVATILRQLIDARTGANALRGLVYVVMIDELNRFAPKGARDAITELIEQVAAEMRSQGVILFGAQQQASKVSEKVIDGAGIRVLGRSGEMELNTPVWRSLSDSARVKASALSLNEKLIIQDNFREPMHVRVPFPVWAMNPQEADTAPDSGGIAVDTMPNFIDE